MWDYSVFNAGLPERAALFLKASLFQLFKGKEEVFIF